MDRSEIRDFYSGQSVFITGVSGLLGKAVLEKLLRSCPNVSKVYILLRTKYGKDVDSRLKEILQSPIFEILKKENPLVLNKVFAISGDITEPNLGIGLDDKRELCKNVSIVIHSAASVKFNEPLKIALNINYNGTQRILELCKELETLKGYISSGVLSHAHVICVSHFFHILLNLLKFHALVHVSTAYVNSDLTDITEEIIAPDNQLFTPQEINLMTDEQVAELTPKIIGNKPNTYTYTKCLAENLLKEEGVQLPISIVRPSIIIAACKEPEPGYVDSLNGMTGVMAGFGKGILTSLVCDKNKLSDLIPLDMTANLILASGWNIATQKPSEIPVYNCCSGSTNSITYNEIRINTLKAFRTQPLNGVIGYQKIRFVSSDVLYFTLNLLVNFIPFFLLDCMAVITRKTPTMLKLLNNILTGANAGAYFRTHEWSFRTDNMLKLENSMGPTDREIFFWNTRDIKWEEYFKTYCAGIKKWIFKEELDDLCKEHKPRTEIPWVEMLSQAGILTIAGLLMFKMF